MRRSAHLFGNDEGTRVPDSVVPSGDVDSDGGWPNPGRRDQVEAVRARSRGRQVELQGDRPSLPSCQDGPERDDRPFAVTFQTKRARLVEPGRSGDGAPDRT